MRQTPESDNFNCPKTALLLIDVINDLEFEGGDKLLNHARPMARSLAGLKERASAAGIPIIYVNDNFGRWRSDFPKLVEYCLTSNVRGQPDRKSTRLNSSHGYISYAVFCLKKKKKRT